MQQEATPLGKILLTTDGSWYSYGAYARDIWLETSEQRRRIGRAMRTRDYDWRVAVDKPEGGHIEFFAYTLSDLKAAVREVWEG